MNGLEKLNNRTSSKPLKLKIKSWEELQSCIKEYFPGESFVVSYLDYRVLIGKASREGVEFYQGEIFDPKFLVKMRVFDKQKELLLWREDEYRFSGRMRIDGEGDKEYLIEAEQLLWGSAKAEKDGWVLLSEARGTKIYLPYRFKNSANKLIKIKTRNYIGYNELGQAGYMDCRFVCFCEGGADRGRS